MGPVISARAAIQMLYRPQEELQPGTKELLGARWLLWPRPLILLPSRHLLSAFKVLGTVQSASCTLLLNPYDIPLRPVLLSPLYS